MRSSTRCCLSSSCMPPDSIERRFYAALAGAETTWSSSDALQGTALARELHVEGPWLAVRGNNLLPVERAELEDTRLERAARNAWIRASAENVGERLEAASINYCIVKGVALLPWLAHPGDRWLDDADILISKHDRCSAVQLLSSVGQPQRHLRYDGRLSEPARDGTSTEWEDAAGVTLDVHFVASLPPRERRGDLMLATPEALAIGLSNHVVLHHALARHFCARHIADLRALLDAGHGAALARVAKRQPALQRSLAHMRWLGAPDLNFVDARAFPVGGDVRDHLRSTFRRIRSLATSGDLHRSLVPSRSYLTATEHDANATSAQLHWRRWKRIAERAFEGR